jgi:pyocin activator protein PrtN
MTALKAREGITTLFFLMGQYGSRAVIPAEEVCRDYFSHLSLLKFIRKCDEGDIPLPLIRAEKSQQGARGVHIQDLASYIDARRAKARNYRRYDNGTTGPSDDTSSD